MISGISTVWKLLIRGSINTPRTLKIALSRNVVIPQDARFKAMPTTMVSDSKYSTNTAKIQDITSPASIPKRRPTQGLWLQ